MVAGAGWCGSPTIYLPAELAGMAGWPGLTGVVVERRGDPAAALAAGVAAAA